MEESAIKAFAAAFDPQPFHVDEAAGRATIFGGLAASGWHTAAATMRLLVTGGLPFTTGLIGLAVRCPGRAPRDPAICCAWKVKSWRSRPLAQSRTRP
jgi:hypothetical protein